ncbi:MAG: sugar transferase, partial [Planctomycetota bacterium]
IASIWRRSPSADEGQQAVRLAAGLRGHRAASGEGRIFDAANPSDADRCIRHVVRHWHDGAPVWVCGRSPATAPNRIGRRIFDIVFSLAALLLTAPLYPLIMFAIWLEDGRPFFFAHSRQTIGGRNFPCYKIRTMSRNADADKAMLAERNVCDGPQFHIEDDPRLLRVGRLLRRLHLDELPQFVNVLLGQMSVIGPRPSPDEENQFCPAWREARLSVKPGITGRLPPRRRAHAEKHPRPPGRVADHTRSQFDSSATTAAPLWLRRSLIRDSHPISTGRRCARARLAPK